MTEPQNRSEIAQYYEILHTYLHTFTLYNNNLFIINYLKTH